MSYKFQALVGGFIWWILIKFCRTKLENEQEEKYDSRNIFLFYVLIIIIGFISVKVF
jgi:hypothetical protein